MTCNPTFYYHLLQCDSDCVDRTYKDSTNPLDLRCRACPDGCYNCDSVEVCTECDTGLFLQNYFDDVSEILCVAECYEGFYPDTAAVPMDCKACIADCGNCTTSLDCNLCEPGYVLMAPPHVGAHVCQTACDTEFFPDDVGICQPCPADCDQCSDGESCDVCSPGYYLEEGSENCVLTCSPRFYLSAPDCLLCPTRCSACSDSTTCTACNQGFSLTGTVCD